jgi:hypothetical protein
MKNILYFIKILKNNLYIKYYITLKIKKVFNVINKYKIYILCPYDDHLNFYNISKFLIQN